MTIHVERHPLFRFIIRKKKNKAPIVFALYARLKSRKRDFRLFCRALGRYAISVGNFEGIDPLGASPSVLLWRARRLTAVYEKGKSVYIIRDLYITKWQPENKSTKSPTAPSVRPVTSRDSRSPPRTLGFSFVLSPSHSRPWGIRRNELSIVATGTFPGRCE